MDRYIGIDAHSESSTVVVMGPSGKRLRQLVVNTQAPVLIEFLKGVARDKYWQDVFSHRASKPAFAAG